MTFTEQLALGHAGERLAVTALQQRGWGVIPSYDFTGTNGDKAPRLTFQSRAAVLPDLDLCREGARCWLEIKTYWYAPENRAHGCRVHGLPKRLADAYAQVQCDTGTPVFIGVLELSTAALLVARLDRLRLLPCQCRSCRDGGQHWGCSAPIRQGVYWDRETMRAICQVSGPDFDALTARWPDTSRGQP